MVRSSRPRFLCSLAASVVLALLALPACSHLPRTAPECHGRLTPINTAPATPSAREGVAHGPRSRT